MRLRDRIRSARERAGISRAALARRVGVRPSAAVQWESLNGTSPSVENLTRIAVALKVRFEWLTTGRGAMLHECDDEAVALSAFAHDAIEERVLAAMRLVPQRKREAVLAFLEAFIQK